jgi:hypothetical protein
MRIIALILLFTAACYAPVYAAQDETNRVFDCGVNTAYFVRRLKGLDADLNEISGHRARDAEKGSSIHDLETYLHASGIKTDARLMRLSDLCKKRGALAILLTHGHDGTGISSPRVSFTTDNCKSLIRCSAPTRMKTPRRARKAFRSS